MEKIICRICGGNITTYETGGYYPYDDDREFHIECENCGELDPTDLIDKCIRCGNKLKKKEYLECENCKFKYKKSDKKRQEFVLK